MMMSTTYKSDSLVEYTNLESRVRTRIRDIIEINKAVIIDEHKKNMILIEVKQETWTF